MNAKELRDLFASGRAYVACDGERLIDEATAREADAIAARALRLLAAAEGGEGTPETDARLIQDMFVDADLSRQFERERNALAARVRELEADAERYRFLKDGLWDDYLTGVIEMRKNAIWDAAIDDARSK